MTPIPELHAGTPFDDIDDYLQLGRLSGLVLSPDGERLVVAQSILDGESTKYVTALWDVDVSGDREPRRLTRGSTGESGAAFTAGGDLLFLAARPTADDDKPPSVLWCLPAGGGEARLVLHRKGGVSGVRTARGADRFVVTAPLMASAAGDEDDDRIRDDRKNKKVSAILHSGYPVRHWDHDLGPEVPHLLAADLPPDDGSAASKGAATPKDLAPDVGAALRETSFSLSSDGTFLVTSWTKPGPLASLRSILVRIDVESGERTVLLDEENADSMDPVVSPDGTRAVYTRESDSTPELAPRITLQQIRFDTGAVTPVAEGWDRWPTSAAWLPDGSALVITADDRGRRPLFIVRGGAEPEQLTTDDAAYTDVQVSPDGASVFALRTSYERPPHPVKVDLVTGGVTELRSPTSVPELPGTLTEVTTVAHDGAELRGWLALPNGATPHAPVPMLLWIHGGPLGSWNTWSWRWCPWLLVAKGYAVLLPDPALSTGYGQEFVQRGWGRWGREPFTDLMAVTDAAVALPEIDEKRTAAMGGSFGGYMANWIAGHTDRFKAIVTHASLWALDQFGPTTDAAWYWQREMTPEMAVENSPHLFVADISTPMLVIHGDRDYRVPIGEGLRLWYELLSESGLPADYDGSTVHRFLYFPEENHWVLAPQHTKVWYEVVEAFLSEHVLGEPAAMPSILG